MEPDHSSVRPPPRDRAAARTPDRTRDDVPDAARRAPTRPTFPAAPATLVDHLRRAIEPARPDAAPSEALASLAGRTRAPRRARRIDAVAPDDARLDAIGDALADRLCAPTPRGPLGVPSPGALPAPELVARALVATLHEPADDAIAAAPDWTSVLWRPARDALDALEPGRRRLLVARFGLAGAVSMRLQQWAELTDLPFGSIGRIFGEHPRFVWYAPGLMARRRDLPALIAAPPPALTCPRQWRLLVDARRSGEAPDGPSPLYPAWTPGPSAHLTAWEGDPPALAGRQGGARRDGDFTTDPRGLEPRHLLAVAIECLERPTIGWVRINRICRVRSDSGLARWTLVVLGAVGAVELGDDWRDPHRVRPVAVRTLYEGLVALRRAHGVLGTDHPAHRAVLGRLSTRRPGGADLAWPDWACRPDVDRQLTMFGVSVEAGRPTRAVRAADRCTATDARSAGRPAT